MGKIIMEQENNKNYLKCVLEEREEIDEDCLAAISDEQTMKDSQGITGIIPVIYSQVLSERVFSYDVNAYLSFPEYKSYITTKDQIAKVFLSIMDICRQTDAYLLDMSYFLLSENYVFVDRNTGKAHLILYPVLSQTGQGDFRKLFLEMMQGIHISKQDMDFYGSVMYELNQQDTFNIVKFRELLQKNKEKSSGSGISRSNPATDEIPRGEEKTVAGRSSDRNLPESVEKYPAASLPDREGAFQEEKKRRTDKKGWHLPQIFGSKSGKEIKADSTNSSGSQTGNSRGKKAGNVSGGFILELPDGEVHVDKKSKNPKTITQHGSDLPTCPEQPKSVFLVKDGIPMTDDDMEEYGKTEDEDSVQLCLVLYYLNEEKYITVNKFPFEIGREGSGFRINPSKTKVSRRHVEIISTSDGYKVCDCSKQGTFLNGKRIPKGSYVPLEDGMKLALKDEEFLVSIIMV